MRSEKYIQYKYTKMKQIKLIKDLVRDEMMKLLFDYSSLSLDDLKNINTKYELIYRNIIAQIIIIVALVLTNLMSVIYIKTFFDVSWFQCFIAMFFATLIMKYSLNKIAKVLLK